MNFMLGLYVGLGLGSFAVFTAVFRVIVADVRRRYCDHKIATSGDVVSWPFAVPDGRVTLTWCARCGAIQRDFNTTAFCSHQPWERIQAYRAKEERAS